MLTANTETNIKKNIVTGFICIAFLMFFFWLFQKAPIPVNQDEFLSIFSKTLIEKTDIAKGSISGPYSKNIFGKQVPVLSYPYVGSIKGLLYYFSGWPSTVTAYRVFNLILLCFFLVIIVSYADQFYLSNWLTKLLFVGLLFGDISFLVLLVTDAGTILLFTILGIVYIRLLYPGQNLAWWKILLVALAGFLGLWNRVNFIWFIGAGLGSSVIVLMLYRKFDILVYVLTMIIATIVGISGAYFLTPNYFSTFHRGVENSIPISDFSGLWVHWQMLSERLNPFSAFHSYIDISSIPTPLLYSLYEWTIWFFLFIAFSYGCLLIIKTLINDSSNFQLIYFILVVAALCLAIVKTRESWGAHHIITIKPYLYLIVSLIATKEIAGFPPARKIIFTLFAVIAVALALISAKGYSDMLKAKPIGGYYDVSWNSIDAVKSACNSKTKIILALDWGVFYPGSAMSRQNQRWEMHEAKDILQLQKINNSYGGNDFGVLFKINGPHKWLLTHQAIKDSTISSITIFDQYKGEPWAFAEIKQLQQKIYSGRDIHDDTKLAGSLLKNGDFRNGSAYWSYTKYEIAPNSANYIIDIQQEFPEKFSAFINHSNFADSRIFQEVVLKKNKPYLVSAYVKTENIGLKNKGAYLCIMEIKNIVESLEIKGDSEWQKLQFIVINQSEEGKPLKIAARLGGYGSMNTGKMWISLFTVTETEVHDKKILTYYVK